MDFDLKTVSVLLAIASAVVTLLLKIAPRSTTRLKRDLELLKLARQAKVNHLPLERHIDAQIRESYLVEKIGFRKSIDVISTDVIFAVILSSWIFCIISLVIGFSLTFAFGLSDDTSRKLYVSILLVGVLVGLFAGISDGKESLAKLGEEIKERERLTIAQDEEELHRIRASDSANKRSPKKEEQPLR
jgi:hypothetical protein